MIDAQLADPAALVDGSSARVLYFTSASSTPN